MGHTTPVERVSVGVAACALLVSLSASGAAGAVLPQTVSTAVQPVTERTQSLDAIGQANTITVPADAAFELTSAQTASTPPPELTADEMAEVWAHPLPEGRLLSQFGHRGIIAGITTSAFHNGIDLAAPAGTDIHAAGSGTVSYVGNGNRVLGLTGWVIVIEHLDGTSTAYNHMYEHGVLVEVGEEVTAGDVIAHVGSAGRATGPHLHFSAWVDGSAVNPVNYLQERGVEVPGGRASEEEDVFGDPYEWDWGDNPGEGEKPIDEPIGEPEPDPVPQQPEPDPKPTDPTDPPAEDPTDPPSEDPTDPPAEDPTDPPTEDPTDPPTEDPTDPPSEDPTDSPSEDPTGDSSFTPTGTITP